MALSGLLKPSLKLILFGGKGGVGKTTCASAAGLYLSGHGLNTLLISTDPAHSLSDSLQRDIGHEVTRLEGMDNLSAIEISAEEALEDFKMQYYDELKRLFETSTYLDAEDIESLLGLPIPGIDEVMGFKKIVDLIDEGGFDKYIVDTAPTGHALRLLGLPELLDDWIKVMAKMRWKYRYMVSSFAGRYSPDSADDFLVSMKKTVRKIDALLSDRNRCEFIVVTIPEDMAVKETRRLVDSLRHSRVNVNQLIINNVVPEGGCGFCRSRRQGQDKYIREIQEQFSDLSTTVVLLQPSEIKGPDALRNIGDVLIAG
ncbi:MAG: ArsA family ATPase [Thermodesulfovibrionales bacterium]|nr:ArsA family ATPase [Thermodesulfovibrionales bacterium]